MCKIGDAVRYLCNVEYTEKRLADGEYQTDGKTLMRNGKRVGLKERFDVKNPNVSRALRISALVLGALVLLAGVTAAVLAGLHHFGGYHTFDHMATWMKSQSKLGLSNGKLLAIGGGVVGAAGLLTLLPLARKDHQHRKEKIAKLDEYVNPNGYDLRKNVTRVKADPIRYNGRYTDPLANGERSDVYPPAARPSSGGADGAEDA